MPVVADARVLTTLPLFQNLPDAQIQQLNAALRRRQFLAGVDIITAEQPGEVMYIILSGTVKIYAEQADGSSVILAILGAGEIFGEMSILENIGRSATVVTLEESTILWMDRLTFEASLRDIPGMSQNLVRIFSRRLRLANAQIQALATLDVFGRVARQILAFAHEYGQQQPNGVLIPLRLTQSDLAGMVGASRVRVNQVLVFYKQQSYISVDQDARITVFNQAALAARCQ
ncbi:MAG: Crp/Fnr family transcriptional regulator [Roseiflexaceae bacterium]|nr:Crp/Fnr family transcriptional regulator [Roseiflexaceae bacterium]